MRVAITGAAGKIGSVLNVRLDRSRFEVLLTDARPVLPTHPRDRVAQLDVRDLDATVATLADVDAIVHLAAIPVEDEFGAIVDANVHGTRNVFEAARHGAAGRVVFASSAHVSGFQPWEHVVSPAEPPRPDTYYGWSKSAGEGLGRLYADRCGLQVVNLRIGAFNSAPVPRTRRIWLSHGDAVRLFTAALAAPGIGVLTTYGTSANPRLLHDRSGWSELGYAPRDSADRTLGADGALGDGSDPGEDAGEDGPPERFHGGFFTDPDYFGRSPR